MLAHEQPANVGEEEAPHGIVWVCVRFRELVMDTVVPDPLIDVVLQVNRSENLGSGLETLPLNYKMFKYLNPIDLNSYQWHHVSLGFGVSGP